MSDPDYILCSGVSVIVALVVCKVSYQLSYVFLGSGISCIDCSGGVGGLALVVLVDLGTVVVSVVW